MTDYRNIEAYIRDNNIKSWAIRTSKTDINSFVFKTVDDADFEENLTRMQRVMAHQEGTFYILEGKDNPASNKSNYRIEFSKSAQGTAAAAQAVVSGIGYSDSDVQKQIEIAIAGVENRFKQNDLERRKKELAEEKRAFEATRNSAIEVVLQKVGSIMSARFPQVAVAGTEQSPNHQIEPATTAQSAVSDNGDDDAAAASALLNRWMDCDADWLTMLEKIVMIAEQDKATYAMAKGYITKMV